MENEGKGTLFCWRQGHERKGPGPKKGGGLYSMLSLLSYRLPSLDFLTPFGIIPGSCSQDRERAAELGGCPEW